MPSFNLQNYLRLRAEGCSVATAADEAGIGIDEAWLHEEDIKSGALKLPRVHVREKQSTKESEMALSDEEATVSMKVGDGPEVPINLNKDLDDPENASAKEQIGAMFANPGTDTGRKLKLFIERVERISDEIKDLNADKSDIFQEAKSHGFDTATIKRIIKLRKMDAHARQEAEALLESYLNAIGMTPIEHAIAMAA